MLVCNVLFPSRTVNISKDNAYDGNKNVIRSIYQVIVMGDFVLEWKVNVERFKIVAKNLSKVVRIILF